MAFFRAKSSVNGASVLEYPQMVDGEACAIGEALKANASGRFTKSGATDVPEFIAAATVGAATPGAFIPAERTIEAIEYETSAGVTVAASLIGQKVTVGSDGLTVTATTTSGVFEVSGTDGVTNGGKIRGFFRR